MFRKKRGLTDNKCTLKAMKKGAKKRLYYYENLRQSG